MFTEYDDIIRNWEQLLRDNYNRQSSLSHVHVANINQCKLSILLTGTKVLGRVVPVYLSHYSIIALIVFVHDGLLNRHHIYIRDKAWIILMTSFKVSKHVHAGIERLSLG